MPKIRSTLTIKIPNDPEIKRHLKIVSDSNERSPETVPSEKESYETLKVQFAEGLRFLGNYLGAVVSKNEQDLILCRFDSKKHPMPKISKEEMDTFLKIMRLIRDTLGPDALKDSSKKE